MATMEVVPAGAEQVQATVVTVMDESRSIKVRDARTNVRAGEIAVRLKAAIDAIDEYWEPHRARAKEAYDGILEAKKKMRGPVATEYDRLRAESGSWTLAEERRIAEEQEKARRASEEKARKEREAEEAEMRRKAEAEEKKRRAEAEAAAKKAAAEGAKKKELEALRRQAEEEAASRKAAAEAEIAAMKAAPVEVAPTPPPREVAAAEGMTARTDWNFEIVDASKLPREYTMPDEVRIRKVVKALKGDANIPGVRVFAQKIMGSKSR